MRVELNPSGWTPPEEETERWAQDTQAADRDHLCEPADPELRLVFFGCKHCGQTWVLESGTWKLADD